MKLLFAAVGVGALILTGCSGDAQNTETTSSPTSASAASTPTPTPTPTPPPTPTPSPEPAVMSKAEAGRVYLDAVCPTNEGARELFEAAQRAGSFYAPDVQPLAADLAESFRTAATTLENPPGAWPEDVQEPILGAVERYLGTYSSLVDLSKATNELQAAEAWNQILQNNDNTAAQLVRLRLDLPAADSADDGC